MLVPRFVAVSLLLIGMLGALAGPRSNVARAASPDIVAIDAGGSAYGSFSADTDYVAKDTFTYASTNNVSTSAVANPAPQAVYQSQRTGSTVSYTIPGLTAGASYTVRLSFVELFFKSAGQRVFNVAVNGANVLSNFDIYAAAGGVNTAVAESFTATASSTGTIAITLTAITNNATINAIEVAPATPATNVVAIDAGGAAAGGFAADTDYTANGTFTYAVTNAIGTGAVTNPAPQAVYQSQRTGSAISYTIPGLTAGATYTVRLDFAELYFTAAGQRVFNVAINGTNVLHNFDIFATAGARYAAVAESFNATASSTGTIAITMNAVTNNATVNGIEIASGSAAVPVPLASPPTLTSSGGSLTFNVVAQTNPANGNPEFLYNGQNVPPTLRLLPGDTLNVNLTNNLPTPPSGAGYTNNTNLHYHGLHVSPLAPGDDSIDMLAAPGQSLHYVVNIPANHPTGLYWYHTHAHGEAERQTLSGMSGALIIDGIAAYDSQTATIPEQILIIRDALLPGAVLPNANVGQVFAMNWAMRHGVGMHAAAGSTRSASGGSRTELHATTNAATRDPYTAIDPNYRRFSRAAVTATADTHCIAGSPEAAVKALTVNGQTQPSIRIAPGEPQFWRVVNASADSYIDFQTDNTTMQMIALDGVPLDYGVGVPPSMVVSHWVLPPSSRAEFVILGPPAGATAYVRTNCFDAGSAGNPMPAEILAVINPAAAPATAAAHRSAAARISPRATRFVYHTTGTRTAGAARTAAHALSARTPSALRRMSAAAIKAATVSATATLYYSDQNTINGVAYDPAAPPMFYAQTGTVQEWTIQNNSAQVHTFHIHQVHFLVEAINGAPQSEEYLLDNVNVPAATASGPGSVKILLDFTDPISIGTFLLHCHILSHEDGGMMAKIRIGTAPPLQLSSANVTFGSPSAALQTVTVSGGAAPYSLTGCNGVVNAAVSGTTITMAPAAAGSCVLTVADSSNPSITSTISITVEATIVISLAPNSVSFTSPSAAAQAVTISGGEAPYSVAGCGGIAGASISGATLSIAPIASGACSLVVTDVDSNQATLSVSVNAATGGSPLDNLTFHGNAQRTGWYQNETTLTTANVASSKFGLITTLAAPAGMPALGKVYAQPLFATGEKAVDGNTHNLVIVAGAADQIYAFDETTHAVVWGRSFVNAAAGVRQQLWTDVSCPDVNPDIGIIGTPVIDRNLDTMYVVVATVDNGVPYTRLHAIALGSGLDRVTPTVISGTVTLATGGTATVSSLGNMNRAALLEANGNIYVALGSHCDFGHQSVHGWVIAYNAATLQETGNLADLTNANLGNGYFLGSPWMSGFGPAADAQGYIYFATGNGPFNGTTDFSMSVLKVPGNLNLGAASYFTPIQEAADSDADADLGAGGVMLLPDQASAYPHLLIAGGKCSANNLGCFKYILNRDKLGGQQNGNAGAVWSADTGGGVGGTMRGGPAYFIDANNVQHIVYGTGPLNTYNLNSSPYSLSLQSTTTVNGFIGKDAGSQEIVSSNGKQAGTQIVWAIQGPSANGGNITLYAFNALQMNQTLFSGVAGSWTMTSGASYIGGAMISPTVADGHVYVPAQNGVSVFGLH